MIRVEKIINTIDLLQRDIRRVPMIKQYMATMKNSVPMLPIATYAHQARYVLGQQQLQLSRGLEDNVETSHLTLLIHREPCT